MEERGTTMKVYQIVINSEWSDAYYPLDNKIYLSLDKAFAKMKKYRKKHNLPLEVEKWVEVDSREELLGYKEYLSQEDILEIIELLEDGRNWCEISYTVEANDPEEWLVDVDADTISNQTGIVELKLKK